MDLEVRGVDGAFAHVFSQFSPATLASLPLLGTAEESGNPAICKENPVRDDVHT
jgi:hypothetical protein